MNSDGETFSVEFADTKEATFDAVNMKDIHQGDFCKFARCDLNVLCDFSFAENPKLSGAIAKGNRLFLREQLVILEVRTKKGHVIGGTRVKQPIFCPRTEIAGNGDLGLLSGGRHSRYIGIYYVERTRIGTRRQGCRRAILPEMPWLPASETLVAIRRGLLFLLQFLLFLALGLLQWLGHNDVSRRRSRFAFLLVLVFDDFGTNRVWR